MKTLGYALSSEEHGPAALIAHAAQAEEAGFEFAMISDHFHPWIARQGESAFVWAVLGAIAQATRRIRVGTGVTCPIQRIHPAIIAHAAATTAALFGDRFFLGVGAGENLNEHVTGGRWPTIPERHARLKEAIKIMRQLWTGDEVTYLGEHFTVDQARLYTLPKAPPPVYLAGTGSQSAALAAEVADGFIGLEPDKDLLKEFRQGARRKPTVGQVAVCYALSEKAARATVKQWWPQSGLTGDLSWELKTPTLVEAACETVPEEEMVKNIALGPDPKVHLKAIQKFVDAGYDHIYIHQIGPDQNGFLKFFAKELREKIG